MSYQVLARKWRPRSFADMVGQQHVLRILGYALDQDKLHHAYLFSGTRGVGKTTLARIFAQCLNCEQGVSAQPCGNCAACLAVHQGSFIDLIEVDAASRAKVEETRDLMDNVQYMPTSGRYKVYLIDEIHMFSNHSFNALLKTLEEPPPHVKFLLATTEPERLPATILSRCLQLSLRQLGVTQISAQLVKILQKEQVAYDDASVHLIARSAQGSMRDALSLLDQAISNGDGQLIERQVRPMLGTVNAHDLTALVTALAQRDGRALFTAVEQISLYGPDYQIILAELLSLLHKAAIAQIVADHTHEPQQVTHEEQQVRLLVEMLDKEDIQLYYQIALTGRQDLAIAPDPRAGFEMILVRMLAFRISTVTPPTDQPISNTVEVEHTPPKKQQQQIQQQDTQKKTVSTAANWQRMIKQMPLTGLVKELASHCILQSQTSGRITLALKPTYKNLLNSAQEKRLENAVKTYLDDDAIALSIEVKDFDQESPAQTQSRELDEEKKRAITTLQQDPTVQVIIDNFDGNLDTDSVKIDLQPS